MLGAAIAIANAEVAADRVMGIWTDSLGVEQVRVYQIEKPEQTASVAT